MIAAIYARKSTDDGDRNAETRSTRRQIESVTSYATSKGWTVDPCYIFVDDAVSGAEWKNRPGFNALLGALAPRPPFDVVIVSELSRIGRDTVRTPAAVMQIEDLWRAVEQRRERAASSCPATTNDGRRLGRPSGADLVSPDLLSDLATCAACGGSLVSMTRPHGPAGARTLDARDGRAQAAVTAHAAPLAKVLGVPLTDLLADDDQRLTPSGTGRS